MLSNKYFLLGAEDPEMNIIESILKEMKYNYQYATVDKTIVHPSNAYFADDINCDLESIVFVECDISGNFKSKGLSIDHHASGDYGFKKNYKQFLEASSIGQLFKLILKFDHEKAIDVFELETEQKNSQHKDYYYENNSWKLDLKSKTIIIPQSIVDTAAIDHCLLDAYRGRCKGIDVESLLNNRITSFSYSFNVPHDEILELFHFVANLIEGRKEDIVDLTHINLYFGYTLNYLIIREASSYQNIPVVVKTRNDKNCNGKLMFFSLKANQINEIKNTCIYKDFLLYNVFGVPSRGYAGGLILDEELDLDVVNL